MRHGVNKIKFGKGKKTSLNLVRMLSVNFLRKGKLTTTLEKAKILKSVVERLVEKAKKKSEANKNMLLKQLGDWQLVHAMFAQIGPVFTARTGGYVRLVRLGVVAQDGSEYARVEWTSPVVLEEKKKQAKKINEAANEQVRKAKNTSKK